MRLESMMLSSGGMNEYPMAFAASSPLMSAAPRTAHEVMKKPNPFIRNSTLSLPLMPQAPAPTDGAIANT